MPTLIKEDQVSADSWLLIEGSDENQAIPDGDVIVPLTLFLAQQETLLASGSKTAVWLDSSESPELIADQLKNIDLIAINFPAFTDGRGYSYAQTLRGRMNYTGELRAFGDFGIDQMFFLKRCGFDSYLLPDDKDPAVAIEALSSFTDTYQTAQDQPVPAFRRSI